MDASRCTACGRAATTVYVCSNCWESGHDECLRAAVVGGYTLRRRCTACALEQQQTLNSEAARARWVLRLSQQTMARRNATMATTGALASIGVAV